MKQTARIYRITAVSLMTALMAAASMVSVPLTVPVTLQTLAFYLSLLLVGGRLTAVSTLVYLALGAVGVPVFSGFGAGVGRLFDSTGGFLFGLLIAALLFWALERPAGKWISLGVSVCAIYLCGTLWYALVYLDGLGSLGAAAAVCVLPFLLPEALKLAAAIAVSRRLAPIIRDRLS